MKRGLLATFVAIALAAPSHAAVIISEVASWGSSTPTYASDWFELTNTGAAVVNITGWKVDDSTPTFATAVALRGVTAINPGQSVIFFESDAAGLNDATKTTAFNSVWFGGSPPAGFAIGAYGGSGIGLSSSGDAVNIYDSGGAVVANVSFGAATMNFSFDNAAGLTGPISTLSANGVNGAFVASDTAIGSPGRIAVPEPGSALLLCFGVGLLARTALRSRRRTAN